MNSSQRNLKSDRKYRVLLLIVIGLAILSSAIRDLNQLYSFTVQATDLVAHVSDFVVPTVSASAPVVSPSCNTSIEVQNVNQSDEFRWNGVIAAGLSIEVKGINGEISAEPATGNEVQVIATKRSRKTDVNLVQMKVTQHAGGVTICALYPNQDGLYPSDCAGTNSNNRGSDNSGNIKNSDVRVDFLVRVPRDVVFIGRTINGEVKVNSLSSNAKVETINGSIKISTSGYAEASTINGTITARLGDSNWPKALTFKTINGGINLDLPAGVGASVDAQTLNGSINSDFPLTVMSQIGRKHLKGIIGAGGRELLLKTLNGSINLKIAG